MTGRRPLKSTVGEAKTNDISHCYVSDRYSKLEELETSSGKRNLWRAIDVSRGQCL